MINSNWNFGLASGISFNSNVNSISSSIQYTGELAVGSVSDGNGNLLFYTNGKDFFDINSNTPFYTDSSGSTLSHGLRIFKVNSCSDEYIVITSPTFGNWTTFNRFDNTYTDYPYTDEPPIDQSSLNFYSIKKVNGLWEGAKLSSTNPTSDIEINDSPLPEGYRLTEKLAIIKRDNRIFIISILRKYIYKRALGTNDDDPYIPSNPPLSEQQMSIIRVYIYEGNSINFHSDISIGQTEAHGLGDLQISPSNSKLAFTNWKFGSTYIFDIVYQNNIIVNFNNRKEHIIQPNSPPPTATNFIYDMNVSSGLEFTSDGKYLYIANSILLHGHQYIDFQPCHIHRVNLISNFLEPVATYTPSSTTPLYVDNNTIWQEDNSTNPSPSSLHNYNGIGMLQRGNDNKIYIAICKTKSLGVINNASNNDVSQVVIDFGGLSLTNVVLRGLPKEILDFSISNVSQHSINQEIYNSVPENTTMLQFAQSNNYIPCSNSTFLKPKVKVFTSGDESCQKYFIEICNCSSIHELQNVYIHKVSVINSQDNDAELVPKGSICFGSISPCECVVRELVIIGDVLSGSTLEIAGLSYSIKDINTIEFQL